MSANKGAAAVPPGKRLGLALGGGAALGISHIGVLRALDEAGIVPDVVAGTSIGSVIGAAYVFGKLDRLEKAARKVSWLEFMRLVDVRIGKSGLMLGESIVKEIRAYIGEASFAEADRPFAAVAVDLVRDEEVVLNTGPVVDALRASISIPGVFTPVVRDGQLLIDGGVKNPVPVSVCRALGADVVIGVDVTGDYRGQAAAAGVEPDKRFEGGLYEVVSLAMASIMRRLAEANFITDPPDVLVVPKIGHLRPYKFDEGETLIEAGRAAAEGAIAEIRATLDQPAR